MLYQTAPPQKRSLYFAGVNSWALGAVIADAFLKNRPLPFFNTPPVLWLLLAIMTYLVKPMRGFWFVFFALWTASVISRSLAAGRLRLQIPSQWLFPLQKIGDWSYSIYLLHMPLLFAYYFTFTGLLGAGSLSEPEALIVVFLTWGLIIPLSVLWYQCIELPGIQIGKRILASDFISGERKPEQRTFPSILSVFNARKLGLSACMVMCLAATLWAQAKFSSPLPDIDPAEANNLAWFYASSGIETNRNGALAVKLAESACEKTQYQVPVMVGTLAAAYAEVGRFEKAIATAQMACRLAGERGETNVVQVNQKLILLYKNHQPYHEATK